MPYAIRTALSFTDPSGGGFRHWYLQSKRAGRSMKREWVTSLANATTWRSERDAKLAFLCAVEHGVSREAIMIIPVEFAEGPKLLHRGPFKISTKNYTKVLTHVDYRHIARGRGVSRKRKPKSGY